ncbi:MAG TPA: O-methyltransferase [Sphingobacteriaceae bacterium]|nr:O-methyltransferase [Sphingobacteriaceae bacterium]
MDLFNSDLTAYLEKTCDAENDLLKQINRETNLKETQAHMLSGHYQGRLLSFLSKLIHPSRILEIGTFTGYATLCLAEGLAANGLIHTIEVNEELKPRLDGYFQQSDFSEKIHLHIGEALKIIPTLDESFDLVFIDADKANNYNYFKLVLEKVRPGGLILIDNVLWKGKVLDENPDKQTQIVLELNEKITSDSQVDKIILPVRDGVLLIRKR